MLSSPSAFLSQQLVKDTLDKVRVLPSTDPAKYAALLKGLIIQGVSKLGEADVKVVCRREDLSVVQAAVDALNRDPLNHGVTITVHDQFLNATWWVVAHASIRGPFPLALRPLQRACLRGNACVAAMPTSGTATAAASATRQCFLLLLPFSRVKLVSMWRGAVVCSVVCVCTLTPFPSLLLALFAVTAACVLPCHQQH